MARRTKPPLRRQVVTVRTTSDRYKVDDYESTRLVRDTRFIDEEDKNTLRSAADLAADPSAYDVLNDDSLWEYDTDEDEVDPLADDYWGDTNSSILLPPHASYNSLDDIPDPYESGAIFESDGPDIRPDHRDANRPGMPGIIGMYGGDDEGLKGWAVDSLNGEFAGFTVKISDLGDPKDPRDEEDVIHEDGEISYGVRQLEAEGGIFDSEGKKVGHFTRIFQSDGTVVHDKLALNGDVQGNGFASQWLEHCENKYREAGFKQIRLEAGNAMTEEGPVGRVGGYAWAVNGFGWSTEMGHTDASENICSRIDTILEVAKTGNKKLLLEEKLIANEPDSYIIPPEQVELFKDPDVRDELRRIKASLQNPDTERPPLPAEIAILGKNSQTMKSGKHTVWAGKSLLLGSHWFAERPL